MPRSSPVRIQRRICPPSWPLRPVEVVQPVWIQDLGGSSKHRAPPVVIKNTITITTTTALILTLTATPTQKETRAPRSCRFPCRCQRSLWGTTFPGNCERNVRKPCYPAPWHICSSLAPQNFASFLRLMSLLCVCVRGGGEIL